MVGMAAFAAAGHVCVVPHAHAADLHSQVWETNVAGSEPSRHSDQPDSDDALHNASCTGLRSAETAVALPTTMSTLLLSALLGARARTVAEMSEAPTSSPPPLFLLHASLLI